MITTCLYVILFAMGELSTMRIPQNSIKLQKSLKLKYLQDDKEIQIWGLK